MTNVKVDGNEVPDHCMVLQACQDAVVEILVSVSKGSKSPAIARCVL